ncbi:MAG: metal ABC transporter ATP-binding protein [Actinomycetota bacterium]
MTISAKDGEGSPVRPPVIRLTGLNVGYHDRPVVRDVSLTIGDGEVVGLLGHNGSGKTTLVRGLLGLAPHISGQIDINGVPIRSRRDRTHIGYVPQHHSLSTSLAVTIREVVLAGRLPLMRWWGRPRAADLTAVNSAIDSVGLSELSQHRVAQLSGGQQRRTLIARALAANPDIIVMDEPTAGVDRGGGEALAKVIRRLASSGVPLLIITHDVEPLRDVLTRTVTLHEGRISAEATLTRPAEPLSDTSSSRIRPGITEPPLTPLPEHS